MEPDLNEYLISDSIVEVTHPGVVELATMFQAESDSDEDFAWTAFNWV